MISESAPCANLKIDHFLCFNCFEMASSCVKMTRYGHIRHQSGCRSNPENALFPSNCRTKSALSRRCCVLARRFYSQPVNRQTIPPKSIPNRVNMAIGRYTIFPSQSPIPIRASGIFPISHVKAEQLMPTDHAFAAVNRFCPKKRAFGSVHCHNTTRNSSGKKAQKMPTMIPNRSTTIIRKTPSITRVSSRVTVQPAVTHAVSATRWARVFAMTLHGADRTGIREETTRALGIPMHKN